MAEKRTGRAFVAGGMLGLGLNGGGAFLMNHVMSHGDAQRPVWHESTVGFTPTTMVVIFLGLVMLAVLYVFDPESKNRHTIFLKFTAAWMIVWAVVSAFIS